MYSTHVPIISMKAKQDVDYFVSTIQFVMQTIRRPFYQIGPENALSGAHKKGISFVEENAAGLHRQVFDARTGLEEQFNTLLPINGINIPKVGFTLQLLGFDTGCIDVHNANLLGVTQRELSTTKDKYHKRDKVWRYIGLCHSKEMISPAAMWDNWCNFIAETYPKKFKNGYSVSQHHLNAINAIHESRKDKG